MRVISTMMGVLKRVGAVPVVLYVCAVIGMAWAMRQIPDKFGRIMSRTPVAAFIFLPFETLWTNARVGDLTPGTAAPDFSLSILDTATQIKLSSFKDKQPVVLVFGSYT